MRPDIGPKIGFFGLFKSHWEKGTGHPRNSAPWKPRDFCKAMAKSGYPINEDTVGKWLGASNLPRSGARAGILKVFFPDYRAEEADPREVDYRALDEAWDHANDGKRNARTVKEAAEPTQKWSIRLPTDIPGLLEFEPQHPQPGNEIGSYRLNVGLRFDTLETELSHRTITIGLSRVNVSIASVGYLVMKGSLVGERVERPGISRNANRGVTITGPVDDQGHLSGDPFGEDYFALIQSRFIGDETLTLTVDTEQRSVRVYATASSGGQLVAADTEEKDAVINALIRKGRSTVGGRVLLAEAQLTKIAES